MIRPVRLATYDFKQELVAGSLGQRFLTAFADRPAIIETTSVRCDEELFERSIRRIEVMTAINHPNLVPVLDVGLDRDQLFLVTPAPDRTADAVEPMGLAASRVIEAVADGLCHLHGQRWLHRDLQLRHIGWYDGVLKLAGFGLADFRGDGRTEGIGPIGGALTMAPSLVLGEPATIGSDTYSLGAALHLLATGEAVHPTRVESLADRICRIGVEAPTISSRLPAELVPVVAAALSADGIDDAEFSQRCFTNTPQTKGTT